MPQENKEFEKLEGGASMILAWRVKDKKVLIVGGGFVAASRVAHAVQADAKVTLVSEEHELCPELKYRIENGEVNWRNGRFDVSDLEDAVMVLADQVEEADQIYFLCKQRNIPVNVADVVERCDFWFMSIHRDGPLQVAVSSNGKGPRIARYIRKQVAEAIPEKAGSAIEQFSILRKAVREHDPLPSSSTKRMGWLIKIVDSWSMKELAMINEQLAQKMLHYYDKNETVSLKQLNPSFIEGQDNKVNGLQSDLKIEKEEVNINNLEEFETLSIEDNKNKGKIQLVGAGPGDPELLTIAAYKAIKNADLIVADRLVSSEIISLCEKGEVKVASPKIIGKSDGVQDQLNEWCLLGLKEGKNVVRLKVGDPFLYGRAGEELEFFRSNGYEPTAIPGISSALGAPSAALLPVTHRGEADQVLISTGNIKGGVMPDLPSYNDKRTLILLMAVGKSQELQNHLLSLGYPPNLPCTYLESYSLPNERIIGTTLDKLGVTVETQNIKPPVCLYIGPTAHFGKDYEL